MSAQAAELPGLALALRRRSWPHIGPLQLTAPAAIVVLMLLCCYLGPALFHLTGPSAASLADSNLAPGAAGHPFGTDALGRDLLSRSLYGGRVSFDVGLGATAIGMVLGGGLGIVAGYRRGWLDVVIMRLLDILLAFPGLVLALGIAAYLGPSIHNEIFAVAFFMVPACARVSRASTLSVRGNDFILAARLSGAGHSFVLTQHVVPNVLAPLMTFGLLQVATAMIIEAGLSFLGLGVRPPDPSWGNMIASGQQYLSTAAWIALVPGAFLFITIASINMLGEAVRTMRDKA